MISYPETYIGRKSSHSSITVCRKSSPYSIPGYQQAFFDRPPTAQLVLVYIKHSMISSLGKEVKLLLCCLYHF